MTCFLEQPPHATQDKNTKATYDKYQRYRDRCMNSHGLKYCGLIKNRVNKSTLDNMTAGQALFFNLAIA